MLDVGLMPMTNQEMGRIGGMNRWRGVSKAERSEILSRAAIARWAHVRSKQRRKSQAKAKAKRAT